MSKPQQWLGGLLAFQILLAAGLYVHDRQQAARHSQQAAILTFDKAAVDKLVLTDKDQTKVTLTKSGNGWQLPDYKGLPADQSRLDELLTTLAELKGGWPVSTSADSQEQFEVSEKKFARKIELFAGNKAVAELYLGTSPGFRKSHVRSAKDSNIYAATINSMDVPSINDQWLDRSLLKAKDLTEIKGADFQLKKAENQWKLEGKEADRLNSPNASALDKSLAGLRVESLQTSAPAGPPTFSLDVVAEGKPLAYQFWKVGEAYTVKRSDNEQSFTISKPVYEALAAYNLAKLTEPDPAKTAGDKKADASPSPAAASTPVAGATPAASPSP
jgi:hypothetical protein